jgi:hypothetical protein
MNLAKVSPFTLRQSDIACLHIYHWMIFPVFFTEALSSGISQLAMFDTGGFWQDLGIQWDSTSPLLASAGPRSATQQQTWRFPEGLPTWAVEHSPHRIKHQWWTPRPGWVLKGHILHSWGRASLRGGAQLREKLVYHGNNPHKLGYNTYSITMVIYPEIPWSVPSSS